MTRLLSVALAAALLTTACGDDDADADPTPEGYVGTWQIASATLDQLQIASQGELADTISTTGVATDIDAALTLNADGTFQTSGGYTLQQEQRLQGVVFNTSDIEFDFTGGSGTWSVQGDKLVFEGGGVGVGVGGASTPASGEVTVLVYVPNERIEYEQSEEQELGSAGGISQRIEGTQRVTLTQ